jgi:branched-chain amino acid transport system substrate-binding protein
MKKLSILGSVLLLLFLGIFSSGCLEDEEDEAKVDCAETFCIGTLLPEGETFNGPLIEAVDLAKSDINKAGGNIEIISGNSFKAGQGVGEAIASAARLIDMGVRGLVAPSYSSDSLEVLPFLSYNQIVSISPSATNAGITEENEKIVDSGNQHFFFRVAPSDLFQAPILAKQSQGNTVIVNRDDPWGEGLAMDVQEEIMSDGRLAEVVSYSSTAPVISEVVSEVEAAVRRIPDVKSIVLLVFDTEGGGIIRDLLESPEIPEETGYYVGDGLGFKSSLFPHVDEENGDIKGFKQVISTPPPGKRLEEFKEQFNFGDFAAHAYDAVVILSLAALSAGSNDPSDYVSKIQEVTREGTKCHNYAACAEALTDGDDIDYEGISGPIDLDGNGDITAGFNIVVETYNAKGEIEEKTYFDSQGEEVNTN